MKVRMKVDISGTRSAVPWPRKGEVGDLPEHTAMHLFSNGQAEPVDGDVESAVVGDSDVETATVKSKPRKRQSGLSKSSMAGDE